MRIVIDRQITCAMTVCIRDGFFARKWLAKDKKNSAQKFFPGPFARFEPFWTFCAQKFSSQGFRGFSTRIALKRRKAWGFINSAHWGPISARAFGEDTLRNSIESTPPLIFDNFWHGRKRAQNWQKRLQRTQKRSKIRFAHHNLRAKYFWQILELKRTSPGLDC